MELFKVINILDIINKIGEKDTNALLSDFSCPHNVEIEDFLKNKAIEFAKKKTSITHIIFNSQGEIAAYFTLTHKALEINATNFSNEIKKKLKKFTYPDEETETYTLSAFLIAQFGKNEAKLKGTKPDGNNLMNTAIETLKHVQHDIGGGIVYLECEEKEQLLKFYQNENNKYKIFGERISEKDKIKYIQLLRFL